MSWLTLSLEATVSVSGHGNYRKKCGNTGWKTRSYFSNMMFHNTEKTETCHGNSPRILFGARSTTLKSLKEAGFVFLLHKLVFIFSHIDWCARRRLHVRISVLEKESASGSTLRSHEQSMEHKDAAITFSRKCNWSLWRIDTELAKSINVNTLRAGLRYIRTWISG